jgi:hypothetical protein
LARFFGEDGGVDEGAPAAAFVVPFPGAGPLPPAEEGLAGGATFAPFAPGGGGFPLPAPAVGGPIYTYTKIHFQPTLNPHDIYSITQTPKNNHYLPYHLGLSEGTSD